MIIHIVSGYVSNPEKRYSKPMVWIGMYIALASLYCILAMVADLLHGLRSRKLWFPCKYFTINAFSLTVIAVAMKLPVDLSGSMPGDVDQVAKLGSMAFMCIMMANLLPCLATMSSTELLTNITALGVMVITLVVNVCIQINTGVVAAGIEHTGKALDKDLAPISPIGYGSKVVTELDSFIIAAFYVIFLLFLLMIHTCSSLALLKSKQIIESKYQQVHETALKDAKQSTGEQLTVEKLQQLVSNYWIMAGSSSPQFIIACSATTTASGVICAFIIFLHISSVSWIISPLMDMDCGSDYKWSTLLILIVQFIGVFLGAVAPLSRCFASLSFKVSIKSILSHIKVFKVEKYWTQKLYDWKYGIIKFPFRSRKLKVIIKCLKSLILNFSLKFQKGVVVVCKIIALIPFFFTVCVLYCLRCFKWLLQAMFSSWRKRTENLEQRKYVLQLENENELAQRTLEGLLKSLKRLIKKSEKKQPNNLMKLIKEKSTIGFKGVKTFDKNQHILDCWSLSVVTLTTIAVTLPNIEKAEVKRLLKSVREGLEYVTLVEENLNATDDQVSIQKAAKILWEEVDFGHRWLGIRLKDIASQVNTVACRVDTTPQTVQLFLEKAKEKINEGVGSTNTKCPDGYSECIFICANSMSRITQTIIDDKESHNKLFEELSSRIADIMAACLTNLPQVIAMKCHTEVIEKREASVEAAAQLLGETKQIINTLQEPSRCVPIMNPDDLPFIDKWRACLSDP